MFNQIDRLLIRGYFKAYFVCLSSMLSLYIVIDLFTNFDDFTHQHHGLMPILQHIGTYYGYRVVTIFDRMCEAVALLAAMFTMAWMQRNNELLPLLSAGVSTRRVVLPVLLSAGTMLSLTTINQELVIPRIGSKLLSDKDDPNGAKIVKCQAAYEPNGILLTGGAASRKEMLVKDFAIHIPDGIARDLLHFVAKEARYVPRGDGPRTGGWLLTGIQSAELENSDLPPDVLERIVPGTYFLYTREVDFDSVTRKQKWYTFASTFRLYSELQKPDSTRLAEIAVLFHIRLTRPLLGLILVVMGLSVILRDQNRNVFISAGLCLVLCGVFFAVVFTSKQLGDNDILSPALAAWLPVLFFGPSACVLFDAVHT